MMSRSKRKNSITGWTISDSDKWWKKLASKRVRRRVKEFLDLDIFDVVEDLENKEVTCSFTAPKDGKQFFDRKKYPKLIRK